MAIRVKVKSGPGLTQGQFKQECDINHIMRRYKQSGALPRFKRGGVYGDFSELGDYMESLEKVQAAQEAFAALPSEVRARFRNDPGELVAFVADEKNRDEAVKLGLVEDKEQDAPAEAKEGGPKSAGA